MAELDGGNDTRKRQLPLWMLGVAAADQIRKFRRNESPYASEGPSSTFHSKVEETGIAREQESERGQSLLISCQTRQGISKASQVDTEQTKSVTCNRGRKRKSSRKSEEVRGSVKKGASAKNRKRVKKNIQRVETSNEMKASSLSELSEDEAGPVLGRLENDSFSDEEDHLAFDMDQEEKLKARTKTMKPSNANKKLAKARSKGRTAKKSTTRKKQSPESGEEIEDPSNSGGSEDEEDLTMDDLMDMAKEYVKADAEKATQKVVPEIPTNSSRWFYTPGVPREESSSSSQIAGGPSPISSSTAVKPICDSGHEEGASSAAESTVLNVNTTGDPKLDLLDLYLGPLLTKPRTEEQKLDTILESGNFSFTSTEPMRNLTVDGGDVPAPVLKKKSSLKDKVAMYL